MSEDRLDVALVRWFDEFAEQGIFTTDTHLIITSWNQWLERHSGRAAAEMIGQALADAYPDLKARGLDERYQEALAGRGYLVSHLLHGHLLPMRARVGDHLFATMPQRARIAPLMAGETVIGTISVIDDVSERVASEHELRRQVDAQEAARAAAEAALRAKDDFLATLSHEIRTPMNAVLGWTRILRDRPLDPDLVARGISVIDRNTMLQARMIDDLLDTARIMTGKLRLQMEPVDLVPVAIAALDVIAPAAEAKGISVTRTLDLEVARVLGDPDRLQQVLWNLLSNALKFTDSGGSIEFRLEQADLCVRIVVKDTGKGISPEFLPYVFDRFRQADPSSSRREGGLGLGLALVKELVALHGGTVTAESRGIQQGATFAVSLPALSSRHRQASAPHPAAEETGDPDALRGVHVLVVEDEPDARDLLVDAFSQRCASVTEAGSASEALEVVSGRRGTARPDIIVADLGLPGQDGYELMRRVRALAGEAEGGIPAVAVSAYAGPETRELARSAGYLALLAKPLDMHALLDAVARAVRAGCSDST